MTQYRVIFTAWEPVNGQMVETLGSSRWYSSLEEAQESQWFLRENAVIATRTIN
jgi:hypothetical protein